MKTLPSPITLSEIESRYAPGSGRHWFDPDTLRFFSCRLPMCGWEGAGGVYFVSSEKGPRSTSPRAFTVRKLEGPGSIETVGEFCGYSTRGRAERVAQRLACTPAASEAVAA